MKLEQHPSCTYQYWHVSTSAFLSTIPILKFTTHWHERTQIILQPQHSDQKYKTCSVVGYIIVTLLMSSPLNLGITSLTQRNKNLFTVHVKRTSLPTNNVPKLLFGGTNHKYEKIILCKVMRFVSYFYFARFVIEQSFQEIFLTASFYKLFPFLPPCKRVFHCPVNSS